MKIIINISKTNLMKTLGKEKFIESLITYLMTRLLAFKSNEEAKFEINDLNNLMDKFEYFLLKKDIGLEDEYLKIETKKNDVENKLDLEMIFAILEKIEFDLKESDSFLFLKKSKELETIKKIILFENEKEYFTNFMLESIDNTINYKVGL